MSIIPTVSPRAASQVAKSYLLQYHEWHLIALRWKISKLIGSTGNHRTHQQASYECSERLKVIETIKRKDITSALILYYRFIKQYRVQRTIAELNRKHISISEGRFYHVQREALLMAFEAMPEGKITIVQ